MNRYLSEKYGDKVATHQVKVDVVDTSGKYYLPDDAILREKTVLGVAVMDNTNSDVKSPDGATHITNAAMRSSYLSLVDINNHIVSRHPLPDLTVTPQDKNWMVQNLRRFNPSKSYVECGNTGALNAGEVILLQFAYLNQ